MHVHHLKAQASFGKRIGVLFQLPLIKSVQFRSSTAWLPLNPTLVPMQDGAPGHRAAKTIQELHERDIYPIFWPAFSPDLNPIETMWNRMKDYIMTKYPDYHSSYDKLRTAVKEAWDIIRADELQALVREMLAQCQAVEDIQSISNRELNALIEGVERGRGSLQTSCRWRRSNVAPDTTVNVVITVQYLM